MARRPLVVRDAAPADSDDLLRLWAEGAASGFPIVSGAAARESINRIACSPTERLLVADIDNRVVGVVHLSLVPLTPLHTECLVKTSFLVVLPELRHRGYGKALLDAAVAWAEESHATFVSTAAPATARDHNRFLARMGFGATFTQRLAPTFAARAKLSPHGVSGSSLGQVMAQRRATRKVRAVR